MEPAVLFVDDEANILKSVERLFRGSAKRVLSCSGGERALEILESQEVGVLVSDHQMPGMTGLDLLAGARGVCPDTVRILMTGHANLATAIEAINRGEVYRFVVKPWEDADLLRIVDEAAERYLLLRSLREADDAKLRSLAQTIELKDPYTKGHCDRVARYALWIASALGLNEADQKEIQHGSWLHDCGKIGVPEAILNKDGPLTDQEFDVVKRHPDWGADVARRAAFPSAIRHIIRHHHERYDGLGYPSGLKGGAIPLEARIVAVADVFDALTSDRPYRPAYSARKAIEELRSMSGTHLEPRLVELLAGRFDLGPEQQPSVGETPRGEVEAAPASGGHGAVILVVDDERNVLKALYRLLRAPGRRILLAETGAEALLILAGEPVDAIITDELMPGMSGRELLERARAIAPECRRILLTGYPDAKVVRKALRERLAHHVLLKPWADEALRSKLESLLGDAPVAPPGT